jgi:hypothetical protein
MEPVPSPYNAATGGVRYAGRTVTREELATISRNVSELVNGPRPPLDPLWRVQYKLGESAGVVYIRASDINALVAELRRLYTAAIRYAVWQVDGEGATYGGTGAPAMYDTLDPTAAGSTVTPPHGDH